MNNGDFFPSKDFNNDWFNNNETYLEDILKLNIGKKAKFYITIPASKEISDKIFEGILEQVGKDYVVISNPTDGKWYFVLLPYLTFISFDELVNYK